MKSLLLSALALSAFAAHAASPDSVIVAAMELSEQPGYAWTTAVRDDANSYRVEGKTQQGYTWAILPMVDKVAQRLGPAGDTQIEAFFRGSACVLRVGGAWKKFKELPRPDWGPGDDPADFWGDPFATDPFATPVAVRRSTRPPRERPYSNARLGVTPPHEELAVLVSNYTTLDVADNIATGTLTPTGAALLLAPGEDGDPPIAAGGTFKIWIQNRRVVRYQLRLEGIVLSGKKQIAVHQISETAVKDVGQSTLEVPAMVVAKLGR